MKKRYTIKTLSILTMIIVGAVALSACQEGDNTETAAAEAEVFEDYLPVVSATGVTVPANWATLSFPLGGVIADIHVEEGEPVAEGDVLVSLKGTELARSAVDGARLELISAQQVLNDLYEYAELASTEAQQAVALAMNDLDETETRWQNQQEGFRASETTIKNARAELTLAEKAKKAAKNNYDSEPGSRSEDAGKASAYKTYAAATQRYDAALRSYNWYTGYPDEIDQALLDSELAVSQARLVVAQSDWDRIQGGPDPKALELAEARLAVAESSLEAAEAGFANLIMDAPFDGTVSDILPNSNEWIAPGQPILLIADLENLQVETTDLSEIDASQVNVGDRAVVTFDAIPELLVDGTVVFIAPKSTEGAGVNFKVIVLLDEIPEDVRWGMTAFVDVEIEQ